MLRHFLFALAFAATGPAALAQNETFGALYKSLPSRTQTTILAINVAHGVAQKCQIRFSRNSVFRTFERQLRQQGESEEQIARTRKAFVQYSKIYDNTPSKQPLDAQCSAEERKRYTEMLRRMAAGEFPDR